MQASFNIGTSFIIDISSTGRLSSRGDEAIAGAYCAGKVGIQLTSVSLEGNQKTIMQTFVAPSEARAIASAMLSAATESRDEKRLT